MLTVRKVLSFLKIGLDNFLKWNLRPIHEQLTKKIKRSLLNVQTKNLLLVLHS